MRSVALRTEKQHLKGLLILEELVAHKEVKVSAVVGHVMFCVLKLDRLCSCRFSDCCEYMKRKVTVERFFFFLTGSLVPTGGCASGR